MKTTKNGITTALAMVSGLLLSATSAYGQSREIPAPEQKQAIAIVNATIHNPPAEIDGTEERVIDRGYVLFKDGRILRVGSGDPGELDGFDLLDAEGLHVYPGLVTGPTQIGLVETLQVEATDDRRELDDEHPEVATWLAVNPDSDLLSVARSAGILTALVFPSGGTIGGQPSAIRMDGWTTEDLAIDKSLGVVINWPLIHPVSSRWSRRSRGDQSARSAAQIKSINDYFDAAAAWNAAREADPGTPYNARHAALAEVLRGDRAVFIDASRASQIESAVAWAESRGLKVVITGGTAAGSCAPLLAERNVPVMLRGTHRLPLNRHDAPEAPFSTPEELRAAGVLFSIGPGDPDPAHDRGLAHNAATAAAHGLPRGAALRSVTLSPAEIAGLGDELGSIERNKAATLLVTTGDPLEITSDILVAFVDGRRIDLDDRQKTLVRKYREKYRQLGLYENE